MRKFYFIVVFLIGLIILSSSVLGVGLSGDSLYLEINYEEGLTKEVRYSITGKTTDTVLLSKKGSLAPYIEVEEGEFLEGSFIAKVTMPDDPVSGWMDGNVCVEDYDPEKEVSGGAYAKTKACGVIKLLVLFEGKSPSASFKVDQETDKVNFEVTVKNYGKETISAVNVDFEIYSSEGELIDTVSGSGGTIESKGSVGIVESYVFKEDSAFGTYTVKAKIKADSEEEIVRESSFRIGQETAKISNYDEVVVLGGIQNLVFIMTNQWAGKIEVFLELLIEDKAFKSNILELEAFSDESFDIYLNTDTFDYGTYDGVLNVYVDGVKKSEENIVLTFSDEIEEELDSSSESSLDEGGSFFSGGTGIVLISILVVLIIGFSGFVIYRYVTRDKEDGDFEDEEDYGEEF